MAYIELNNIQKSFADGNGGQRIVLDELSLEVEQGAFVAVTGVSGTGKTTLLNVLGTLLKPDGGTYLLGEGHRSRTAIQQFEKLQIRNRQIGFMFQDYRLLPQFTALQNILLPTLAIHRKPTTEETQWAMQLAQQMGISEILQQLPETLSGGEKSRVALCRALIMRPKLLLADEPTGQLDSQHAKEVGQLLRHVNTQMGMTIILVTHSEELASIADKRYVLKEGKVFSVQL